MSIELDSNNARESFKNDAGAQKNKNTIKHAPPIEKIVERIFARFSAQYGFLWTKIYLGSADIELVKDEWVQTLRDLTLDQIHDGIKATRLSDDPFPPAAKRFRALCVPAQKKPKREQVVCIYCYIEQNKPIPSSVHVLRQTCSTHRIVK